MESAYSLFHIKQRLNSWTDMLKLIMFTMLLALFFIPIVSYNLALVDESAITLIFSTVAADFFLLIFVLPPALVLLCIGYAATHQSSEKKIENAGYGYISGFLAGIMILFFSFGANPEVGTILVIAVFGFSSGVLLSYVALKPLESVCAHSILRDKYSTNGAPFQT